MPTKILVVDDDALVRRSVKFQLESAGYAVTAVDGGEDAISHARHDQPDLILLDVGLPDRDGLDVARTLHHEMQVPIIFLTGRDEETDIVVGLEIGAEDYITKPFSMRELMARVRVVLRRAKRTPFNQSDETLAIAGIVLDPKRHQVTVNDKPVDLPPKEFELLRLLMANMGAVLSTDHLLDAVWGEEFVGAVQVLYVHIGWLRERIESDPRHPLYIHTVRGVGYKFEAMETES